MMDTTKTIDELVEAAELFRSLDLKPLPLFDGKSPKAKEWPTREFEAAALRSYLQKADTPGIGVQMGPVSGIIDVEWDSAEQRAAAYEIFGAELLDACPAFGRPDDADRGHRLLAWDDRLNATNAANLHIPCGDGDPLIVRLGAGGKGSQSAFPPSPNKAWLPERDLASVSAPALSDSVIEKLLTFAKPVATKQDADESTTLLNDKAAIDVTVEYMLVTTKNMEDANDGSKRMLTCMHRCYDESLSDQAAIAAFRQYESERPFSRDYDDYRLLDELRRIEQSGKGREPSQKVLTDASNAELLARHHGKNARYIGAWRKWVCWDGKRWKEDDDGQITRFALDSIRSMRQEAAQLTDKEARQALWTHAKNSEARNSLDSMIFLAQKILPMPLRAEELNRNGWLLNFNNGTLDLKTGELRRHRRGDYLTKIVPFDYLATVKPSKLWVSFLDRIFNGDAELVAFVQRLLGYSLVGAQLEHVFPVMWGSGQNGKSTLVNTLRHVVGDDYSMELGQEYLMQTKHSRHSTEVMDLYQMRLAVSAETEEGAKLNEARVKHQTGGGRIRGRKCFQDSWEYEPTHTLFVETNHRPRITGTDDGIWRRVLLIPFTVRIPDEEKDPNLGDKLKQDAPAILRWLVEGCLAWQQDGLNAPATVLAATAQYRSDSDLFGAFINECCKFGPNLKVRVSELYDEYAGRARQRGEMPQSAGRIEERLEAMKILKSNRTKHGYFYLGVDLTARNHSFTEIDDQEEAA